MSRLSRSMQTKSMTIVKKHIRRTSGLALIQKIFLRLIHILCLILICCALVFHASHSHLRGKNLDAKSREERSFSTCYP